MVLLGTVMSCPCLWPIDDQVLSNPHWQIVLFIQLLPPPPLGGDGGEEDSGEGPQLLHCVTGLRLPDKGGAVSGHDHHEWRRSQVISFSQNAQMMTWARYQL